MTLQICDDGHDEICYEQSRPHYGFPSSGCPMCELKKEIEALEKSNEELRLDCETKIEKIMALETDLGRNPL